MLRAALRQTLRFTSSTNLPGRYQLVELLRPLITENRPIVTQIFDNITMELNLNDLIQRQIFFQLYDRDEIALLNQLVRPGDVVFDVGGNVGLYAITLAQRVGGNGTVHVFEPIPENLNRITRNIELNHFEDRVVINSLAVSDQDTRLELYLPSKIANSGWASIVPSQGRPNLLSVQAITLDTYVQQRNIASVDLIKMDIEGSELGALNGMEGLLSRSDAPMIYLEINPFLLEKQGIDSVEIKTLLHSFGYRLFALEATRLQPVAVKAAEQKLRNILATKRAIQ